MVKILGPRTTERAARFFSDPNPYKESGLSFGLDRFKDEVIFRNDSSEDIPPYGCFKILDAEKDGSKRNVLIVDKPDGSGGPFGFNGDREVGKNGGYGILKQGVIRVLFGSGTPVAGEIWGPESDWEITPSGQPAVMVYGEINPTESTLYGNSLLESLNAIAQAPEGGVPARAANVLGSAQCTIWRRNGNNLVPTNQTPTVYNWVTQDVAVTGMRLVAIHTDIFNDWYVHAADCNDL